MLASHFRLKKKREIEYILQKGKKFTAPIFIAKYTPNNVHFHRFTIITSQKFSHSAVVRNRTRRILYETIRLNLPTTPLSYSYDCVIIPFKSVVKTKHEVINGHIFSLLHTAFQ
ncbi:ribonuclease P protein component [Candidatus Peregrinibacteria bacterium]|nr:ribonuclease P protein component [Candidatus Peregrinibacteria bacterium]